MRRGNAVVIVALLVFLALAALLPLTVYLRYRSAAIAATAGLFGLPVLLVFLLVIILAAQPSHAAAVRKPAAEKHYPWEKLFAPRKVKEAKIRYGEDVRKGFGEKVVVAVLLIIALALLIILSPAVRNILGPDLSNLSNATDASKNISAAVQPPITIEKQEPSEGRNASGMLNISNIGRIVKQGLLKVPRPAIKYAAIGLLGLFFLGILAYSYRTGGFRQVAEWSADWLAVIRKNAGRLAVSAAVVIMIAAAFAFRKRLNLAGIFGSVMGFLTAYRLYIIIGVAALVIIIGILVMLERRGNNSS